MSIYVMIISLIVAALVVFNLPKANNWKVEALMSSSVAFVMIVLTSFTIVYF